MAVTRLGAGAGGMNNGLSALTYNSFNVVTSDANTVAIVGVSISVSSNSTGTTCSVTYGGVAMTQLNLTLAGSTTNRNATGIYYLFNPGTGVKSVVVTPAGAATKAGLISNCALFSGVGAVGAAQTAAATTHAPTSAASGYDIRVLTNGAALTSPNQTQENLNGQSVLGDGDYGLIQSAAGTGSTISFTATGTATNANSVATALTQPLPKLDTLTDDFATKDTTKWTWSGTAAATSGQLNLTPNLSYTDKIVTTSAYDLTSSSVIVRLVQTPNLGNATAGTNLRIFSTVDNTDWLEMGWYGGWQTSAKRINNVYTDMTNYGGAAITDRWLRLRESGGTISWDTSADGLTWTNRFTQSTAGWGDVSSVQIQIYAGFDGTEPSPGTAIWDNLNVPPTAAVLDYNYPPMAIHRAATR